MDSYPPLRLRLRYWLYPAGVAACLVVASSCRGDVVVNVHDGDTLKVRNSGGVVVTVRLAEVDAPELKQKGGEWAAAFLREVCPVGSRIDLERVGGRPDRYGRLLAKVSAGGEDVAAVLVARGAAWVYPTARVKPALVELEALARVGRVGLWGASQPEAPWLWRKRVALEKAPR